MLYLIFGEDILDHILDLPSVDTRVLCGGRGDEVVASLHPNQLLEFVWKNRQFDRSVLQLDLMIGNEQMSTIALLTSKTLVPREETALQTQSFSSGTGRPWRKSS
jgi:hypothetical protein